MNYATNTETQTDRHVECPTCRKKNFVKQLYKYYKKGRFTECEGMDFYAKLYHIWKNIKFALLSREQEVLIYSIGRIKMDEAFDYFLFTSHIGAKKYPHPIWYAFLARASHLLGENDNARNYAYQFLKAKEHNKVLSIVHFDILEYIEKCTEISEGKTHTSPEDAPLCDYCSR